LKILDRYVTREIWGPFVSGLWAFGLLLIAGFVLPKLVELITGPNPVSLKTAGLIFLYRLPFVMALTFPMSVLLGALQGFGRLSSDSEIIAIYAGGISFRRILMPVVIFGILVSIWALWFNEQVVPWGNGRAESLLRAEGRNGQPKEALVIQDREDDSLARLLIAERLDARTQTLTDVTMLEYRGGKPVALIWARSAKWLSENRWEFREGFTMPIGRNWSGPRAEFPKLVFTVQKSPQDLALMARKPSEMNYRQLREYIEALEIQGADVGKYLVQLHQKIALPLASLVFVLIGAPLGLRPHRGGSALGFGLAIMIAFLYYVLAHFLSAAGASGSLSPMLAAWLPNLVGTALGGYLIARAPN